MQWIFNLLNIRSSTDLRNIGMRPKTALTTPIYVSSLVSASRAGIAQLVEHNLAKVGVAGSSPVSRSRDLGVVSFD